MREDVKTLEINNYTNAGANTEEIDELIEYWEQAGGCKLNQLLVAKLNALLKAHGLSAIKAAIDKANDGANNANYGFSLEYVKNKLLKGGENNGKKVLPFADKAARRKLQIEYKEPEYTAEELKQALMDYTYRYNERIQKPQFHLAISCRGDEYTHEQLLGIAHQYLREMESDLGRVKAETAAVMAESTKANRQLEELKEELRQLREQNDSLTEVLMAMKKVLDSIP